MNKKRIRINLKPGSIEGKNKEFLRQALKRAILAGVIFWAVLIGINFLFGIQIKNLNRKLSVIEKEWLDTEPLLKERDYLLEWKDSYNEVFNFLKGIFRRDLSWHSIFESFCYLVPQEMWFKEIVLRDTGAGGILEIKASIGYLNSDEEKLKKINSFLEAVKKDKVLSEHFAVPDLQDVSKTRAGDEDVLDLNFSLTLKK